MEKKICCFILFLLSLQLFSCSNEETHPQEILARVNGYNLTTDEFQAKLAGELELNPDFKLTEEAKRDFLDNLINKELLIQEAKKLELDRKDKFIRTIERYWESTLIRDLVEIEGNEIARHILIPEADIQAQIKKIETSGTGAGDSEKTRKKAMAELMDRKSRQMLKEWMIGLRKNADIEINQDLLQKEK